MYAYNQILRSWVIMNYGQLTFCSENISAESEKPENLFETPSYKLPYFSW